MLKASSIGASFQKAAGKLFASCPLTPNQITAVSVLAALVAFYFAYLQQPLASLLLFVVSGAIDAIDGAVARERKMVSARGAYIDGISDRLVEFLMLSSFLFYALPAFILPAFWWILLCIFFGSCMTSFATAYAEHRKVADAKKLAKQPGILPRAERLFSFFLALLLVPFSPQLSVVILAIASILCTMTFLQRFLYFSE